MSYTTNMDEQISKYPRAEFVGQALEVFSNVPKYDDFNFSNLLHSDVFGVRRPSVQIPELPDGVETISIFSLDLEEEKFQIHLDLKGGGRFLLYASRDEAPEDQSVVQIFLMKKPSTTISKETTSSLYAGVKAEGELLIDIGSSEFVTSELANLVTDVCPGIVDFLNKLARGEVTENTAVLSVDYPDIPDNPTNVNLEPYTLAPIEHSPDVLSLSVPPIAIDKDRIEEALAYTSAEPANYKAKFIEVLPYRDEISNCVARVLSTHSKQVNNPEVGVSEYEESKDAGVFTYSVVAVDVDEGKTYSISLTTSEGVLICVYDTAFYGDLSYFFMVAEPPSGEVAKSFGDFSYQWVSSASKETSYAAATRQLQPAQLRSLIKHFAILKADVTSQ